MLTRNCVKNKLLKANDKNARVTVFSENLESHNPASYKVAWLNAIRSSLGKGILASTETRYTEVTGANGYYFGGFITSAKLMDQLQQVFWEPVSLRISFPGWPTRSWVLILEQDIETKDSQS